MINIQCIIARGKKSVSCRNRIMYGRILEHFPPSLHFPGGLLGARNELFTQMLLDVDRGHQSFVPIYFRPGFIGFLGGVRPDHCVRHFFGTTSRLLHFSRRNLKTKGSFFAYVLLNKGQGHRCLGIFYLSSRLYRLPRRPGAIIVCPTFSEQLHVCFMSRGQH